MRDTLYSRGGYCEWIDTAKGIGVFLVVLGHLCTSRNMPIIKHVIFSFHVPLFFILSGYLLHCAKREEIAPYVRRKACRMLLPAVIYITMTLPLYFYTTVRGNGQFSIATLFYYNGKIAYNSPCWYFIVLFEAVCAERILNIACSKPAVKVLWCAAFFSAGYALYVYKVFLPFGLDRAVVALGFLSFGMLMRQWDEHIRAMPSLWQDLIVMAACGAVWWLTGIVWNERVSFFYFDLGRYWLFVASSVSGSLLLCKICKRFLRSAKTLARWGRNSIFVVGTHYVLIIPFKVIMNRPPMSDSIVFNFAAVIYTVVLLALYMPVCDYLRANFPVLTGDWKASRRNDPRRMDMNVDRT